MLAQPRSFDGPIHVGSGTGGFAPTSDAMPRSSPVIDVLALKPDYASADSFPASPKSAERLDELGLQFDTVLKRSRTVPLAVAPSPEYAPKRRAVAVSLLRSSLSDPTRSSAFTRGGGASVSASKSGESVPANVDDDDDDDAARDDSSSQDDEYVLDVVDTSSFLAQDRPSELDVLASVAASSTQVSPQAAIPATPMQFIPSPTMGVPLVAPPARPFFLDWLEARVNDVLTELNATRPPTAVHQATIVDSGRP
ncbi:Uncharacterized protein PBTT_00290 [Plasmodiophora brassicae]